MSHLFVVIVLLAVLVIGVAMFAVGSWRHSSIWQWAGALLCIFVVAVVVGQVLYDSALEWNPVINKDSQVTGVWSDHDQTVTLASDHTFIYQAGKQTTVGQWTRDDWNLHLHGDPYSGEMRFIQFNGSYRLMTHPPDDPDTWNGDLRLRLAPR